MRSPCSVMESYPNANVHTFYVEAVVGADNPISQAVAAATISDQPEAGSDKFAEVPVLQYVRKFDVRKFEPAGG